MTSKQPRRAPAKPKAALRWSGILFALVANLLFVYLADRLVRSFGAPPTFEVLATLAAPVLAGVATAVYVRVRGGVHALIGGMLSIPLLALLVFGGPWQFALLAGAFCGLGGALAEIALRGRTSAG